MQLAAVLYAVFPERDPIVKTISILWITALVLGCFLIYGNKVQAEDKMLAHEEIRTLVTALGTGLKEQFDLSKLRY